MSRSEFFKIVDEEVGIEFPCVKEGNNWMLLCRKDCHLQLALSRVYGLIIIGDTLTNGVWKRTCFATEETQTAVGHILKLVGKYGQG